MNPCEQRDKILSLEKRLEVLTEIHDLVKRTHTAISGDPKYGIVGLAERVSAVEETVKGYEQKRWFANGAVWMVGLISGVAVWAVNHVWPKS